MEIRFQKGDQQIRKGNNKDYLFKKLSLTECVSFSEYRSFIRCSGIDPPLTQKKIPVFKSVLTQLQHFYTKQKY